MMEGYSKSYFTDRLFVFIIELISGFKVSKLRMTHAMFKRLNPQVFILLVMMMFLGISNLSAQTNEDCLACHDDASLTSAKPGKKVSRYIPANALEHSVHKSVTCASCHKDAAVAEFPHPESL